MYVAKVADGTVTQAIVGDTSRADDRLGDSVAESVLLTLECLLRWD